MNSGTDAGVDTGVNPGTDTGVDTGVNPGTNAGVDTELGGRFLIKITPLYWLS